MTLDESPPAFCRVEVIIPAQLTLGAAMVMKPQVRLPTQPAPSGLNNPRRERLLIAILTVTILIQGNEPCLLI